MKLSKFVINTRIKVNEAQNCSHFINLLALYVKEFRFKFLNRLSENQSLELCDRREAISLKSISES